MNQPDQAQAAYKRAIETDDSQLLAWQGLASLYEREADNEDFQANLPEVYRKMIDLYQRNDKDKVKEFSLKLADLFCQQGKHFEAVKTLEETVKNCGNSQENYEVYLKMEAILQEKESGDLKVLMKEHNYDTSSKQQLIDECKAMSVMFPSAVYPLDVLGKIYLASTPTISSNTEVPDVFETLCSLDPCSDIGKIGLGWDLLVKHNYEDSMLLLQQGYTISFCLQQHVVSKRDPKRDQSITGLEGYSECPTGWLYLSHVHCHFHDYISAEKCLLKGLGSLDVIKAKDLRSVISYKLRLNLGKCLCKQGRQQAEKAKELLLDLISFGGDDPEVLTSLGESSLILDDMIDASEYCSKALNIDKTYHGALALQGRISAKEGLFDDAELRFLEAIELCRDCPLYYFFLGQLYWDMTGEFRTDKEKCLMHLLKAAKLDPNYPPTFLYLGHYYREVLTDIK
ncbi:Tetratricopeptide repeat protein 37 [Exaiptasia diaphana]|nr:Tetratricopeptide repeat protein 37 [Exaiptasia diaphana]